MQIRIASLFATATAFALAGAAVMAGDASIEDQRSATLACKQIERVGGAAYITQRRSATYKAGQMNAMIVPYDRVTHPAANAINSCAAARLGLRRADIAFSNSRTTTRSIRNPAGDGIGCGTTPSVLYRGDLYCQWSTY